MKKMFAYTRLSGGDRAYARHCSIGFYLYESEKARAVVRFNEIPCRHDRRERHVYYVLTESEKGRERERER